MSVVIISTRIYCNFWPEFPEILSENLICYHLTEYILKLIRLCGILINISYCFLTHTEKNSETYSDCYYVVTLFYSRFGSTEYGGTTAVSALLIF